MAITVVVADDHPVVIDGIRFAANAATPPIKVLSQVSNVESISDFLREHRPDVLVMEVRLGGQDALKKLEDIRIEFPNVRVVAFSGLNNPTHIARAAALGCADYVAKSSNVSSLFEAVKAAANGFGPPEHS